VQQLEALGNPPVQQPSLRRADLRVGRVAQQVVGEVVAVPELAHDPAPPQLVDGPHHDVSVQVAGLGEQVEGAVPADRSGQAGHLAAATVACSSRLRSTAVRSPGGRGAWPRSAVAARGLDHVEREASRRRLEQQRVGLGERFTGNRLARRAVSAASKG